MRRRSAPAKACHEVEPVSGLGMAAAIAGPIDGVAHDPVLFDEDEGDRAGSGERCFLYRAVAVFEDQ